MRIELFRLIKQHNELGELETRVNHFLDELPSPDDNVKDIKISQSSIDDELHITIMVIYTL